ncbi:MAG: dihydrolipoyl dehydrogenase [Clostridiales bacterium]|nr:dihydrolipoyl dehydrogenase [Clostridiales bacterium]
MMERFDLIVIGSGPGGYVAAIKAARLGLKTAIIEKDKIGGTCLNRGCIPTKTLMHGTNFLAEAENIKKAGITFTGINIDFFRLTERKNEVVEKIRSGIENLFKANGIKVFSGRAAIISHNTVRVELRDGTACGETADLVAKNILIATGSVPAVPKIEGANLENVVTSDDLLESGGRQYRKLLIIGGGVIGVEMATIYNGLGCEVEIIEAMDRILPGMDREISQSIGMGLKKKGIVIHTGAKVTRITEGGAYGLACEYIEKDSVKTAEAEGVLISVGRRAYTEGLFGEDVNIETESGYIKVNSNFETSIPGIYAIGDVIRGKQLAHAASAQGVAVVEKICGLEPSVDLDVIPSCVYTVPEVAAVGLSESEAAEMGYRVKTGKYPMLGNSKTMLSMGERGFIKLVCDADTGRILGAQLLCDRATDMVGELALAISRKLTYKELASIIRPHPTYEEAITEAAEDVDNMAIHVIPRKTL